MMKTMVRASAGFISLALATLAEAHPLHAGGGWSAGLAHPFLGWDHALAMIAVGLWAAQLGRRAMIVIPVAFLSFMALGALLAFAGFSLPWVEAGTAASVLALGLLIVFAARLPVAAGAVLVGVFALLHGHAHGDELPATASAWSYAAGFITATATLLAVGLLAGNALRGRALRIAGACVALVGLALLANV
jgi:urease accessory protein